MVKSWTDQLGNSVAIHTPPTRIISLVPSQTELLFDLGLEDAICGVTKFCVHPKDKVKAKTIIGGTKKFNLDLIRQLNPDLIIGNKEENYAEGIAALQQHYPVWMSDVITLADACEMIIAISSITEREEAGSIMVADIKNRFAKILPFDGLKRVAYMIWQRPYMVAASGTFIHEMLTLLGLTNVFEDLLRYPEVTMETIVAREPDLIFLSSEPYPFTESHQLEFQLHLPDAKILLVDGEYFSWYGSRLLQAPDYFKLLRQNIGYYKK